MDNTDTEKTYGWYSSKQLQVSNKLFYYKDIDGKKVQVTMVSNNLDPACLFDDLKYVYVVFCLKMCRIICICSNKVLTQKYSFQYFCLQANPLLLKHFF